MLVVAFLFGLGIGLMIAGSLWLRATWPTRGVEPVVHEPDYYARLARIRALPWVGGPPRWGPSG